MSVTNIKPTSKPEYWFIELADCFLSGVTDPGFITTTKYVIEHGEDKTALLAGLQAKSAASKLKRGFSVINRVFDRLSLEE